MDLLNVLVVRYVGFVDHNTNVIVVIHRCTILIHGYYWMVIVVVDWVCFRKNTIPHFNLLTTSDRFGWSLVKRFQPNASITSDKIFHLEWKNSHWTTSQNQGNVHVTRTSNPITWVSFPVFDKRFIQRSFFVQICNWSWIFNSDIIVSCSLQKSRQSFFLWR